MREKSKAELINFLFRYPKETFVKTVWKKKTLREYISERLNEYRNDEPYIAMPGFEMSLFKTTTTKNNF